MVSNGVSFKGITELDTVFQALGGAKFATKTVDGILRKGAQPMLKRAKELSSNADLTGETTKSIGIIANRKINSITLGPRRGGTYKGYIAHILEYGAAPHVIKAKAAGGLLTWAGGRATEVNHPGIAAQPFMRPAYDETGPAVVQSITDQCAEIITSEFKSVKF